MKIICLLFGLLFGNFASYAQLEDGYHISGNIKNLRDGITFYLIGIGGNGKPDTISKVISKNGKFIIDGKLELEGQLCFIKMDTSIMKIEKGRKSWIRILLDNSKISITGDVNEWPQVSITGSPATSDYERFEGFVRTIKAEAVKKLSDNSGNSSKRVEIEKEYNKIYMEKLADISESYAAPLFIFNNAAFDVDTMETAYLKLTDKQKGSFYGKKLNEHIAYLKMGRSIAVGNEMPDFAITFPTGDAQSVKEAASRSKLTLIDFWASWCAPCRKDIPNLKKAYSIYGSRGFNVISISIDTDLIAWKKALKEENMPWVNGIEQSKVYRNIFGIAAIPAQILVNDKFEILVLDYNSISTSKRKQFIVEGSEQKGLRGNDLFSVIEHFLSNGGDSRENANE